MRRWLPPIAGIWIVLFCLAGALVGWLVSLVMPSPHRATKELFVGLNISRSADDRNAVEHAGLPISERQRL